MTNSVGDYDSAARWGLLARMIDTAQQTRAGGPQRDARTMAIIVSGAVDAIVAEQLANPDYDTATAAEELIAVLDAALTS